jgi:hypothetical protein
MAPAKTPLGLRGILPFFAIQNPIPIIAAAEPQRTVKPNM